ncbi:hypothetical protein H6P81_002817 [Aristolochia fimbriata]|uniref:Aminotransferase-like plant mobile domain-containing protein n=1 Tax=Aristolochia fimbriata TaxID=158543 RepID=A0AAV7FBE2_ARIFI|nr:hypothetical protein H6P81_002817 [Aristolochia fimbriata]
MVKHGSQSMLVLFLKRDTYPYEMDNIRSLGNLGGTGEGAVIQFGGESSEDSNYISSSEDAWPNPVTEEVEEEEEVEFSLPTMGVPPLEKNDESYPGSWIGEMDMDVRAVAYVFPRPHRHRFCIRHIIANLKKRYSVKDLDKMVWRCVVMADTPLLYDQDSHRSEAIWHGESSVVETGQATDYLLLERWRSETNTFHLANSEMTITLKDVAILLGLRVDGFTVIGLTRGDWMELAIVLLRVALEWSALLDASPLYSCGRGNVFILDFRLLTLLKERALHDGPLGSRTPLICFEIVKMHVPNRVTLQFGLEQVTPLEDVEHVTGISPKGRAREDWAAYHRDYIARWEARTESIVTVSCAHTPRHAPSEYMTWYLSVTRRFISPPPAEPTMVYYARGYIEEALLGCVRNVVERVYCREAAMDPSLENPYLMEIGHYCQPILHSLPLLEGTIVGGEMSYGGEPSHVVEPTRDRAQRGRCARCRPTSETTTHCEDPDEVPVVPEPTVPDLPPVQTPEPEPEQPSKPEPSRHPPIRRIYTRRQKKAIGAPEPSSAL